MIGYMGHNLTINNPSKEEVLRKMQSISLEDVRESIGQSLCSVLENIIQGVQKMNPSSKPEAGDIMGWLLHLTNRIGIQTVWKGTPQWGYHADFSILQSNPFSIKPIGTYYPYVQVYDSPEGIYHIDHYLELFKYIYPVSPAAESYYTIGSSNSPIREAFFKEVWEQENTRAILEGMDRWDLVAKRMDESFQSLYSKHDVDRVIARIVGALAKSFGLELGILDDCWEFYRVLYDSRDSTRYCKDTRVIYWPRTNIAQISDSWHSVGHWLELGVIMLKATETLATRPMYGMAFNYGPSTGDLRYDPKSTH